jgi:hypothetical protein
MMVIGAMDKAKEHKQQNEKSASELDVGVWNESIV